MAECGCKDEAHSRPDGNLSAPDAAEGDFFMQPVWIQVRSIWPCNHSEMNVSPCEDVRIGKLSEDAGIVVLNHSGQIRYSTCAIHE